MGDWGIGKLTFDFFERERGGQGREEGGTGRDRRTEGHGGTGRDQGWGWGPVERRKD